MHINKKYDIKIIASDLDGTLCYHHGDLILKNLLILKQALDHKIKIILTTGRPLNVTLPVVHNHKLNHGNNNEFIISYTGASIYDLNLKKEIKQFLIPIAKIHKLWKKALELKMQIWGYQVDELVIANNKDDNFIDFDFLIQKRNQEELILIKDYRLITKPFYKLIVKKNPRAKINQVWLKFLQKIKIKYYGENEQFYEILDINTSKGNAIKWIANYLNIPLDKVMSLGDAYNDVSMFKVSKISVAMKDGLKIAKKNATFISELDHDQGAVQAAIKKYVQLT